jgi:hypothetical protein
MKMEKSVENKADQSLHVKSTDKILQQYKIETIFFLNLLNVTGVQMKSSSSWL